LQGDFLREPVHGQKHDLKEIGHVILSNIVLRSRERFYVVKLMGDQGLFSLTVMHFPFTIIRSSAGRRNPGLGRGRIGDSHFGGWGWELLIRVYPPPSGVGATPRRVAPGRGVQ
jgi:hypothetical protein